MFKWWDVLPDNERQQWTLDPFVSVGPLGFGMCPDEVSRALSDVAAEPQRHTRSRSAAETVSRAEDGAYQDFGLKLYYRRERLAGVVVDALRGHQVFAEGMALVGRVPSALEQWMIDRADYRVRVRPATSASAATGAVAEDADVAEQCLQLCLMPFGA